MSGADMLIQEMEARLAAVRDELDGCRENLQDTLAAEEKALEQLAAEKLAHLETMSERDGNFAVMEADDRLKRAMRAHIAQAETELTAARAERDEWHRLSGMDCDGMNCPPSVALRADAARKAEALREALGECELAGFDSIRSPVWRVLNAALSDSSALEWLAARERKVAERVRVWLQTTQFVTEPLWNEFMDALLKETP